MKAEKASPSGSGIPIAAKDALEIFLAVSASPYNTSFKDRPEATASVMAARMTSAVL
jgi:hypothetical protein